MIGLRAYHTVEQDDEERYLVCNVTLGVQPDHGAPLELGNNIH